MTRVFAHRGVHDRGAVENTVAAFEAAVAAGADGVEFDVRRTADGALVVHHDAALDDGRSISSLVVADLDASVPLLAEVVAACGALAMNVEIKNDPAEPGFDPTGGFAAQVVAELEELCDDADVIISSFDVATLDAVRGADGDVAIGLLLGWGADVEAACAVAADAGFTHLHPFVGDVDAAAVARCRAMGLGICVWTVDTPADLERMKALGVDVVITDDVMTARDIVGA
jgi:glycerophosphoryl diester phosphodiesterase